MEAVRAEAALNRVKVLMTTELRNSELCDGRVIRAKSSDYERGHVHVWSDSCQYQGTRLVLLSCS
jgi:hypothetical protein